MLGRRSVLSHVIHRIAQVPDLEGIVLIAGIEPRDEAIVDQARRQRVAVFRSPADRPSQAMAIGLGSLGWEAFVAVRATSPLIDPMLIREGVERFRLGDLDLLGNQRMSTFPAGQEIEVLSSRLLLQRAPFLGHLDPHASLTRWFARLIPPARQQRIDAGGDWSDVSMSAESLEDLERLRWFLAAVGPEALASDWKRIATEMRRLGCARFDAIDDAAA